MKVIIVGGVAGGASAAARLRRLDEKAQIILLERGDFISFANCGLPYYIGGRIVEQGALTLQTPESFRARFNVEVRVLSEAVSIDREKKQLTIRNLATKEEYQEGYDKLILSPGAEPLRPPVGGEGSRRIFTLRSIPDTLKIKRFISESKPRKAVVMGGGYIGVEMAENLVEAGLEVTIVQRSDHLIVPLDYDMACVLEQYMRTKGVKILLKSEVRQIADTGSGLHVELAEGGLDCDLLILSVGVRPEGGLAAGCGLAVNQRGAMATDKRMLTADPDIFAVGDAVEVQDFITGNPAFIPLAGPANRQGRIAADNICGLDSSYTGTQGTSILKVFDMAVATTGLNEVAAKRAGIDYDKTYGFPASHASYYPGATNMGMKILWDKKTHRLLGAQIVGFDGVDKRMDVIATAIRFGGKVTDLVGLELCYAPPFGSAKDPVNLMGFVAENVITGKVKQFFWHDIPNLPQDGSVSLLDVRTRAEVADMGGISGFVNIPLDELRQNLDRLPKDKPVYVHCLSGQRSYIACRILTGNGYDCYNLAGGFKLYQAIRSNEG